MAVPPRYETEAERPSLSTTGVSRLGNDRVVVVGVNQQQLKSLLLRQDPESKIEIRGAAPNDLRGIQFSTFHGQALSEETIRRSTKVGAFIVEGPRAGHALDAAVDLFKTLRKVDLVAVFIDFD